MKISVTVYDQTITMETPRDDITLDEFINDFVYPLTLALGYSQDQVDQYFL